MCSATDVKPRLNENLVPPECVGCIDADFDLVILFTVTLNPREDTSLSLLHPLKHPEVNHIPSDQASMSTNCI
jgi:hypothetical protein